MGPFEVVIIFAALLGFLGILAGILPAVGRFRGGAVVVAGAVVAMTCLLFIGVFAVFWLLTWSVVESRPAIAITPAFELGSATAPATNPPPPPVPPGPPTPAPNSPVPSAPAGSTPQGNNDGPATGPTASLQPAAPTRSPTPIHTAKETPPPAWVDERAARVDGEYHFPIRVGPYTTPLECEQNLLSAVNQAVDEYIALYLGEQARGRVRLPRAFIEERLIRERWYENRPFLVTSTEQAEMTVLHALLVFDSATNDYLKSLWRSVLSLYRVSVFAAGFVGVLWLLAVAWSYLKLDQMSAGRYRGRLRAAAVIAVVLPPLLLALLLGFGGNWTASLTAGA